MALVDYQPTRVTIDFKDGSFQVRGLGLVDLGVLLKDHLDDLDALIALYEKDVREDVQAAATAQYAVSLVREAPGLVANVIALASDEPDSVDQARSLSMPLQVKALSEIGRLTFEESGGPKNFFESLKKLFGSMRPVVPKTGFRI